METGTDVVIVQSTDICPQLSIIIFFIKLIPSVNCDTLHIQDINLTIETNSLADN